MKSQEQVNSLDPAGADMAFNAPWQARAFALARLLCESGRVEWGDFRTHLIAAIGAADPAIAPGGRDGYYERFLEALVNLLDSRTLISPKELAERERKLAAAPPPKSGPGGRLR